MVRFVIITLSLAVFGLSLAFPAICFDTSDGKYPGSLCLMIGWLAILEGMPMWLANPLLLLCLIFLGFKQYGIAFGLGLPAVSLALYSLSIKAMACDDQGVMIPVTGFGAGFYLWLLSMVIPTVGSFILSLERKQSPDSESHRAFRG
jgi:hypothetical protein